MHFLIKPKLLFAKRSSIAVNFLINNKFCKRILILDLDVHQGNGTAEIFKDAIMFILFLFMERRTILLEKKKVILIMPSMMELKIKSI